MGNLVDEFDLATERYNDRIRWMASGGSGRQAGWWNSADDRDDGAATDALGGRSAELGGHPLALPRHAGGRSGIIAAESRRQWSGSFRGARRQGRECSG